MSELVLHQAASDFAVEMQDLLNATLPGEHRMVAYGLGPIYVVRPDTGDVKVDSQEPHKGEVPLMANGTKVASLRISCRCMYDSAGKYLALHGSYFGVHFPGRREPLLRLEYGRDTHTDPVAHWQIHGEASSLALARQNLGLEKASRLSTLHLPVGGHRMRPCLEDLIELLVRDFAIDALGGWEEAVKAGRQRWRRHQTGAIARDAPGEAVRVLRELGYKISEPAVTPPPNAGRLEAW